MPHILSLDALAAIVRDDLGCAGALEAPDIPFEAIGLDSLGRLELLTIIETRYGITIPEEAASEQLTAAEILSYGAAVPAEA